MHGRKNFFSKPPKYEYFLQKKTDFELTVNILSLLQNRFKYLRILFDVKRQNLGICYFFSFFEFIDWDYTNIVQIYRPCLEERFYYSSEFT